MANNRNDWSDLTNQQRSKLGTNRHRRREIKLRGNGPSREIREIRPDKQTESISAQKEESTSSATVRQSFCKSGATAPAKRRSAFRTKSLHLLYGRVRPVHSFLSLKILTSQYMANFIKSHV